MSLKNIITVGLIAFVAISVGYMLWTKASRSPVDATAPARTGRLVTVYYFYTNVRCATCREIERLASEAVRETFGPEVGRSEVVWSALNTDKPEYAHFNEDFKLITKSVVVEESLSGKRLRWKNLDRIWDLVRDPKKFKAYISSEVAAFVRGA
jgi:hypothetical protein